MAAHGKQALLENLASSSQAFGSDPVMSGGVRVSEAARPQVWSLQAQRSVPSHQTGSERKIRKSPGPGCQLGAALTSDRVHLECLPGPL